MKLPVDNAWKVACAVALCGVAAGAGFVWLVPVPAALDQPPPVTRTVFDCRGRLIARLSPGDSRARLPLALDNMGHWLPRITVALEDHRFAAHHGIDWHALAGAVVRNLRHGRVVSGGSTITQQLVKMAGGRCTRSWGPKLCEAVAAWKLERRWDKRRILAAYLNRNDYGNRLIGPEAAAQWYFGKNAAALTLAEAVYLAGIPQAPTRFNPWRHPAAARARYLRAVNILEKRGVLGRRLAEQLAAAPPVPGRFPPENRAPHFTDALDVLARDRSPAEAVIRTTLDLELQRTAQSLLRVHLRSLRCDAGIDGAVVVIENATGAVRAMVGAADYARNQVNGALTPHSAGSTLKPFVYLEAIERGVLTAATLLPDTPDAVRTAYADYDPQNYARQHHGPVSARAALASSLNVPAVVALQRVGARRAFDALRRWGFRFPRTLDDYGAGFVLGNAEVRLVDLAAAYAGLARGGLAAPATLRAGVPARFERVASPEAAAIVTDILCDPAARQLSFGTGSPLDCGARVAAKTGTSSGFRDAWTVGFNRRHTVAVWIGRCDGRPMDELSGIRAAAPLWAALMQHLLAADGPLPAPIIGGRLVETDIVTIRGEKRRELFLRGTEQRDRIEWENGHPVLPVEFAAWCRSPANRFGAVVRERLPLAITMPSDGAQFVRDPALPLSQQMLELTARAPAGARVEWLVNDAPLPAGPQGRVLWPLQAGCWRITARAAGEEAHADISVR